MTMIAELNLQPTPQVYHVFYSYLTDEIPELCQIVRVLIRNTQELNEETVHRIYHKYLGSQAYEQRLSTGVEGLQAAFEKVEEAVHEVIRDTEGLYQKFDRVADTLEDDGITLEDARVITRDVSVVTRDAHGRYQEFGSQLDSYYDEIRKVRTELELVRRDAMTDTLTGIANRKNFDSSLRDAVTSAMENGCDLSLLMIDIDHFKSFNDSHGHRAGDGVLKAVARVLVNSTKGADTVARYGGEEFSVILPETSVENARKLAGRLCENVARQRIINKKTGKDFGRLTVSIGLTSYRLGENILEFVDRADAALYQAKQEGRNTCVMIE